MWGLIALYEDVNTIFEFSASTAITSDGGPPNLLNQRTHGRRVELQIYNIMNWRDFSWALY